jgi:chemotaxis protein MotB
MSASAGSRRAREGGSDHDNEERWLLTYSDMITLLMALFIVMWAISSVNISKFNQLKASLQSAFSAKVLAANDSILSGQQSPFSQDGSPVQPLDQSSSPTQVVQVRSLAAKISNNISASIAAAASQQDVDNLLHIQQIVEQYAKQHGLSQLVTTKIDQRGLVVRLLTDKVLFRSGQATLEPEGVPLIGEIAKLLSASDIVNPVRVEGNTDDVAIHSARFPSNWELSTARADAVLEVLLAQGVAPTRLSATGYGDVNPIASNATAAGRARNRRVDIVILRRSFGQKGTSS